MKTHIIKTDMIPFIAMWEGDKTLEFRWNDRDYQVGDKIVSVYAESLACIIGIVTHIQHGYGIPSGYVCMSIKVVQKLRGYNA
jgi:hypothetical protein